MAPVEWQFIRGILGNHNHGLLHGDGVSGFGDDVDVRAAREPADGEVGVDDTGRAIVGASGRAFAQAVALAAEGGVGARVSSEWAIASGATVTENSPSSPPTPSALAGVQAIA